ncbi:MAG: hypothetical protein RL156_1833 [Bacteroidota bacterium]|jgi:DNA repair protein RadC
MYADENIHDLSPATNSTQSEVNERGAEEQAESEARVTVHYAALRRPRRSAAKSATERTPGTTIRDWRNDEIPSQRLRLHGAHTLSDAEIVAILVGSGTRGRSALDVARNLLEKFGDLPGLLSRDISELASIHGIAGMKAVRLIAALECSRRLRVAPFTARQVIRTPEDVASYYIPLLRGAMRESFRVLLLNSANQVYRESIVSEGSLNSSLVHPREVFRTAITDTAASLILLHNHPSGNTEPSREDRAITHQLCEAGKIVNIKILDHVIIAGETYTSFSERGLL